MPWSLVTAPDERERCCFVDENGNRCGQRTRWRVTDGSMDGTTHVCSDHLELVRRPGDTVEPIDG